MFLSGSSAQAMSELVTAAAKAKGEKREKTRAALREVSGGQEQNGTAFLRRNCADARAAGRDRAAYG